MPHGVKEPIAENCLNAELKIQYSNERVWKTNRYAKRKADLSKQYQASDRLHKSSACRF